MQLASVRRHCSGRIKARSKFSSQLGAEPNDDEVAAITAFLSSLTGELREITYPVLPPETTTTPLPSGEVKLK